ncbi:MAG: acetyl-CoA decarbonylase/synthase complex subunit delta [Candidatus Omnitrophota bacterium]
MDYDNVNEAWRGKVTQLSLSDNLTIGGETALSYHRFEGEFPNRPAVAMEVNDIYPADWLDCLKECIGDNNLKVPAQWASKCVKEYGADLIFLDMVGTHQDKQDLSPSAAKDTLNAVLSEVSLPVIIRPYGNHEKQNKVITVCAQSATRQLVLGSATQENYRTFVAAALGGGHYLVAESPIDVNIAKQLNILITQMNFPQEKIIMDPLTGGLGYGLEYTYSVMERIRLQTFSKDSMMSPPMICCVGQEVWKIKEARAQDNNLGDQLQRCVNWEVTTAISLILSGANIVVVRCPKSVKQIKAFIDSLYSE